MPLAGKLHEQELMYRGDADDTEGQTQSQTSSNQADSHKERVGIEVRVVLKPFCDFS